MCPRPPSARAGPPASPARARGPSRRPAAPGVASACALARACRCSRGRLGLQGVRSRGRVGSQGVPAGSPTVGSRGRLGFQGVRSRGHHQSGDLISHQSHISAATWTVDYIHACTNEHVEAARTVCSAEPGKKRAIWPRTRGGHLSSCSHKSAALRTNIYDYTRTYMITHTHAHTSRRQGLLIPPGPGRARRIPLARACRL